MWPILSACSPVAPSSGISRFSRGEDEQPNGDKRASLTCGDRDGILQVRTLLVRGLSRQRGSEHVDLTTRPNGRSRHHRLARSPCGLAGHEGKQRSFSRQRREVVWFSIEPKSASESCSDCRVSCRSSSSSSTSHRSHLQCLHPRRLAICRGGAGLAREEQISGQSLSPVLIPQASYL